MPLTNTKAKIEEFGSTLTITIPSQKNLIFPIFSVVWFIAWFFFYQFALDHMNDFLKFWLIGWSIAGIFMIALLLWFFFGYEQLEISKSEIVFSISVLGLKRNKIIRNRQFISCTFNEKELNKQKARKDRIYLLSAGKIKIEYQFDSFSFGAGLTDAEAKHLIERINKKMER